MWFNTYLWFSEFLIFQTNFHFLPQRLEKSGFYGIYIELCKERCSYFSKTAIYSWNDLLCWPSGDEDMAPDNCQTLGSISKHFYSGRFFPETSCFLLTLLSWLDMLTIVCSPKRCDYYFFKIFLLTGLWWLLRVILLSTDQWRRKDRSAYCWIHRYYIEKGKK